MSVAFAEPVLDRTTVPARPATTSPARVRTRPRRPGPGLGPAARPRRLRFVAPPGGKPRLCRAEAVVPRSGGWQLTERGLAVVLVLVAALVVASLAVVGLTALRVTGESYHPVSGVASRPLVQP